MGSCEQDTETYAQALRIVCDSLNVEVNDDTGLPPFYHPSLSSQEYL